MSTHPDKHKNKWPRGLMRRGDSFRFSRMVDGRRLIEVWGSIPEGDAIRKAARYNVDIDDGIQPIKTRIGKQTTLADFTEIWLKKKATELRPKSLARYHAVIDHFLNYLNQSRSLTSPTLSEITYALAMDYMAHRAEAPMMPNGAKKFTRTMREGAAKKTIYFERGVLFQLFREAIKRDLISKNPFEEVRPKKPTINEVAAAHHPLTRDEEEALLKAATLFDARRKDQNNPRFHDIVLFLVRTGLRLDEMRCLEWSDIDFEDRIIKIREKSVTETRSVKIAEEVVPSLTKQIGNQGPHEPLFRTKSDIETFGIRLKIRNRNDLLKIKTADVDLANRKLSTTQQYVWKPKGTNGVVPLSTDVEALLKQLREKKTSNFVFAHFDGGSCRLHLLEMLKQVQKMAGIPGNLRIHDLRHTLAFRLRRAGVHLETIMGVMRHSDIKETLIYAPYNISEGRQAMQTLDEGNSSNEDPQSGKIAEISLKGVMAT